MKAEPRGGGGGRPTSSRQRSGRHVGGSEERFRWAEHSAAVCPDLPTAAAHAVNGAPRGGGRRVRTCGVFLSVAGSEDVSVLGRCFAVVNHPTRSVIS